MATSFTPTEVDRLRRQAKQLSRQKEITHSEALNRIAVEQGFTNWSLLAKHSEPAAPAPRAATPPPRPTTATHTEEELGQLGIEVLNMVSMPPDMRARLVPQLKVFRWAPGQYAYRFEVDESEWGSKGAPFVSLAAVLRGAAEDGGRLNLADIVLNGMPLGDFKLADLRQSAEKIAADIAARHPDYA